MQADAPARSAGRDAEQRDVGLDGQVDQGFGVGLWGDVEATARVGSLSATADGEQA